MPERTRRQRFASLAAGVEAPRSETRRWWNWAHMLHLKAQTPPQRAGLSLIRQRAQLVRRKHGGGQKGPKSGKMLQSALPRRHGEKALLHLVREEITDRINGFINCRSNGHTKPNHGGSFAYALRTTYVYGCCRMFQRWREGLGGFV